MKLNPKIKQALEEYKNGEYTTYTIEEIMSIKPVRKLNELKDEEVKEIAVLLIGRQFYYSNSIKRNDNFIEFNFAENPYDKLPCILTIHFDELDFLDLDKPLGYPNESKYDNSYRIPQMKVIEVYNYLQSINIQL